MNRITLEVAGTRLETTNNALAQLVLMSGVESVSSAHTLPALGQYWDGQGGIYAGLMRGENGQPDYHLVVPAGSEAEAEAISWGTPGEAESGACSEYDGTANTAALMQSPHSHPAAEWAAALEVDGHSDFYLPSRRELRLCWVNVPELFAKEWYWTSTQYSPYGAWFQSFGGGGQGNAPKANEYRARAVRRVVTP